MMTNAKYDLGGKTFELVAGSITQYSADALVCPANPDLEMVAISGGVQFAFLRDGGIDIFNEAQTLGNRYVGERGLLDVGGIKAKVPLYSAHLTGAGKLSADYVIHSVSVDFSKNGGIFCNPKVIAKSTQNVLVVGKQYGLKSIGFPTLCTGLYSVPLEEAVETMVQEFGNHLQRETSIERIGLVIRDVGNFQISKNIINNKFGWKEQKMSE